MLAPTRDAERLSRRRSRHERRGATCIFFNGLGGFTPDGREYVITPAPGRTTPAPWVNVLANPQFGTVVTESGAAYTWARTPRVPPHAVAQRPGQRRERRGVLPPRRGDAAASGRRRRCRRAATTPYVTRHGFGYSIFEYTEDGIAHRAVRLRRARRAGQVLGAQDAQPLGPAAAALGHRLLRAGARRPARRSRPCTSSTEIDPDSGALLCAQRVQPRVRRTASRSSTSTSATRTRHRRPHRVPRPQRQRCATRRRMRRARLSGRVGAGLDPCAAMQVPFDLADGQEREIVFRLGLGPRRAATRSTLAQRFRGPAPRARRSKRCGRTGSARSARCTSRRPIRALNFLANGWLLPDARLPHVGAHRLLPVRRRVRLPRPAAGRDGAGPCRAAAAARAPAAVRGAPVPRRRRAALVASARRAAACARTSPTTTSGCRWRPAATSRPPATPACSTRRVPFLDGRPVRPDEESYYDLPRARDESARSTSTASARSSTACASATHGLPLMGCGDWNDGMNLSASTARAKASGSAFFLYDVLAQFAAVARARGDDGVRRRVATRSRAAAGNIEQHALGRRVVSPRVLRRRHAARLGRERRVPDRLDLRRAGRCSPAPATPERARMAMDARRPAPRPPRRPADPAARPAVRQVGTRTPATSRATSPACARTAASTRTRRSGP